MERSSDPHTTVLIEVVAGIYTNPKDTPELAAYRKELVPEVKALQAQGLTIDIPGDSA